MLLSRRRPHHLFSGHRQPEARQQRHRTILTGQTPIDGAVRDRSKSYQPSPFPSYDHCGTQRRLQAIVHRRPGCGYARHQSIAVGLAGRDHRARAFDAFTPYNDPYGEHDFGSFDHDGRTISWKIDLYDRDYKWYSPGSDRSGEDQSRPDDPPCRGVLIIASEPGSHGSGSGPSSFPAGRRCVARPRLSASSQNGAIASAAHGLPHSLHVRGPGLPCGRIPRP